MIQIFVFKLKSAILPLLEISNKSISHTDLYIYVMMHEIFNEHISNVQLYN
jgi:hypothetical protein